MLFVRPARGNGKSLLAWEQIKEAVENGETVVLVRHNALYRIDKHGIAEMPFKRKQQHKEYVALTVQDWDITRKTWPWPWEE